MVSVAAAQIPPIKARDWLYQSDVTCVSKDA